MCFQPYLLVGLLLIGWLVGWLGGWLISLLAGWFLVSLAHNRPL